MHQPTAEARPTLYYAYRVHEPWLATRHPVQQRQ